MRFVKFELNIPKHICKTNRQKFLRTFGKTWLVWLSGLSVGLQTKGFPVQSPVRAHAWVAGQVPGREHVRGHQLMFLSHIDVSLPLFLPSFPSL